MRRALFATAVALCLSVAAIYFGYRFLYPVYTYRYRLSFEVDAPGGIRSGSSVVQVKYETTPNLNGSDHVSRVSGDAIFIDLGDGKSIVALLASGVAGENVDYPAKIVFVAFHLNGNDPDAPRQLERLEGRRDFEFSDGGAYELAKNILPTFVTFSDVTNPKTVQIVPPALFDQVLGAGIKLRRFSIEMTKDAATQEINKKLLWLPHPTYLSGSKVCGPGDSTYCLHGGQFLRGD